MAQQGAAAHKRAGSASKTIVTSVLERAIELQEKAKAGNGGNHSTELKDPKAAVQALEMVVQHASLKDIKEKTGLSLWAVAGLRTRHKRALAVRREELAQDGFEQAEGFRLVIKAKLEQLSDDEEALAKASVKDLALGYAISQDKAFAALGEAPRVVIEHRKGPSIEDAVKAIQEAQEALKAGALEVVASVVEEPLKEAS